MQSKLWAKKTLHRHYVKVPTAVIADVGLIRKLKKSLEELKQQLEVTID
jgi:hypothetical protein